MTYLDNELQHLSRADFRRQQKQTVKQSARFYVTQAEVEQMVKALNEGETIQGNSGKKIAPTKLPEEYNMLKKQLSDFFQSKVQLSCSGKGKGKISIPFENEEELTRIIELFDKMRG